MRLLISFVYVFALLLLPPIIICWYARRKGRQQRRKLGMADPSEFGHAWSKWLETNTYVTSVDEGSCAICLSDFLPAQQVRGLPCKHLFHVRCFDGCFVTSLPPMGRCHKAAVLICYGCFVTILPPVLIVVVAYVLEKSHSADKRREKCEKAFFDEWSLWVSSETKIEKLSDADIEDCMEKGDNSGCVICLEDFAVSDDVRVLPCGHKFHVQCFDSCFDRLPCNPALEFHQCPLCRTQLGPSLPKRNLTGGISDDIIINRTSSVSEASTTVSV
ncbi:hypothetical protein Pmar_PMAR029596 [Perkinsus marinus ATCC 50983]|uniref:RING-type domain-containing protein n=1 Tax=Perkinsus marinus (strain ATCC 50983 / TXsc) TaxID=423536 RepID=C5KWX2_PERM5|nr:hypothetical protein Pmar_PMAR029596 [Perkinsus marinus ATCC 50983]EER10976.1 hypothetical protein Pmar_PMAR029596 [Perkinsus marinus ATCC 50983]|eukprot:XP_002779181.1 hypothetical protein Pmar_PMAR029596 [Perkinsus marinus ATCC 50983]